MVQFLNRKLSHHNELAHCRVLGKRLSLLKGSLHSEHSHVGLLQQHCCLAPYPINPVPSWSSDFCGEPLYVLVLRDLNLQSQKGKEQVAVIERGGRYDGQPARRNSPRNGMDSIKKKKKAVMAPLSGLQLAGCRECSGSCTYGVSSRKTRRPDCADAAGPCWVSYRV